MARLARSGTGGVRRLTRAWAAAPAVHGLDVHERRGQAVRHLGLAVGHGHHGSSHHHHDDHRYHHRHGVPPLPPVRYLSTHGGLASSATNDDVVPPRDSKGDDGINKRMVLTLAKHLWPDASTTERANELKGRVALSLGLMVAAKVITIQVPFLFKDIIDRFSVVAPPADAADAAVESATAAIVQVS